jgi:hypothetical protein
VAKCITELVVAKIRASSHAAKLKYNIPKRLQQPKELIWIGSTPPADQRNCNDPESQSMNLLSNPDAT